MNEVNTRRATIDDLEAMYRFNCELVEAALDKAEFVQCYEAVLDLPRNHFLVACVGDMPVGFISCKGEQVLHYVGYVYEIMELYINAAHRSSGIGRLLVMAVEEIAKKEDAKMLMVSSNMRRKDAHRFYISCGFDQSSYRFKKKIQ